MITRSATGHRCGQSHHRSRISDSDVQEMRRLYEAKEAGYKKLAKLFECGESTVRDIVQYRTRWSA